MHVSLLLLVAVSCYALVKLVKYQLYVKPMTSDDIPCYTISAPEGSSMVLEDSEYIIKRIGYYVGQGSKKGLKDIDVKIDLRYAKTSSIYKAIGAIESSGAKVSETQAGSPMQLMFNIQLLDSTT